MSMGCSTVHMKTKHLSLILISNNVDRFSKLFYHNMYTVYSFIFVINKKCTEKHSKYQVAHKNVPNFGVEAVSFSRAFANFTNLSFERISMFPAGRDHREFDKFSLYTLMFCLSVTTAVEIYVQHAVSALSLLDHK